MTYEAEKITIPDTALANRPRDVIYDPDEHKEMSHVDFMFLATTEIAKLLSKRDYERLESCAIDREWPDSHPRIWFKKKNGNMCWVILGVSFDENVPLSLPNIFDPDDFCFATEDGYFAPVIFESEGKKFYSDTTIKMRHLKKIITKIYDAKTGQPVKITY